MPYALSSFVVPLSLITLSLFGTVSQAADAPAAPAPPPPEVTVEVAKAETFPIVLEYSGRTAGYREVQVRAQVSGILQQRTYEEGSKVKAGQVLFRIDPRPYQAALMRANGALAQAQARYRQTDRDLKRIRELQKKGFASESELDNAVSNFEQSKANVEAAKADVETSQINLDYTTVVAPISGITSKQTVSEGSLVVASDPNASLLTQLTQLDPLYVNFAYPDTAAERLREGVQSGKVSMPSDGKLFAQLKFGDGSDYPLEGRVDFTDSFVSSGTGTVSARAVVPNPNQNLLPGQFMRVVIKGLTRANAITVPERALLQGPKGTFVYVVDEQGLAHARQVTTGPTSEGRWVIEAGLNVGDKVIVEGVLKVRPESPVKASEAKAASDQPAKQA
ncbi:efflux RND transporter periplasmic adaptor subunit [Pseudomonas sp. GV071]|uniref:efflux RND transporter periplasmic adaptor subunit n=1 Tax=Pseudomonas sp. GV071 TaxID=2135754 RepID=UPI000D355121|nr:efflux RND transporter periplasmic adaptor subunit [Pseudomonas sp. GV071]PTQ67427.1 membrane fusion protein (multidrug efflux system) [Pseudomonas sp. GV071]